jgi:UDPglucose 6-dehydrogenase
VGIDVDAGKVELLANGRAPFFEPGFPELLVEQLESGRLSFSTDFAAAQGARVHFLAVGTPQRRGEYAADLTYVNSAIEALLPHLRPGDIVAGKSTVPVGTAARLFAQVGVTGAIVAWNPEFLREGFAVADTLHPDRLVYGLPSGAAGVIARSVLDEVYAEVVARDTPVVIADHQTAELVKVAANAFLATKISFINAMAEIAETVSADVTILADAIGHDARIGRRFLNAGVGFGGGCLPKDIRAFTARAEELGRGESVAFLKEVDAINLRRRERVVDLVLQHIGEPYGKSVAVLGLAFKPDSDDVRDSPALDVAVRLNGLGAKVTATDPEAIANSANLHPQLTYVHDVEDAVADADAVVILTEWTQYRQLDPWALAPLVRNTVVVDGRNCLDREAWQSAGWTVLGLGRPALTQELVLR